MLSTRRIVCIVAALATAGTASTQTTETGFLDRSVVVEGREYLYQVYVPRNHQASVELPVIMYLHGGGSRLINGIGQTNGFYATAIRANPERFPAIVVFPQAPLGGTGWHDLGGRVAMAALDTTLTEFQGDASRVYLTGQSMGGNGSWYLAYHHPERFAAVVPTAGWIRDWTAPDDSFFPAIPPRSASDPFVAVARVVAGIPIWIFHGDEDPVVPVSESRGMAAALEALGADVQYTELEGVGHGAGQPAVARDDLFIWLFGQRRR